mmetsp:Transcript_34436/g.61113  ORF Transcript_34436/g.61113 Transcript_34436/m.61113 type:complete len:236 (+) Transcript_34436:43-750(+)
MTGAAPTDEMKAKALDQNAKPMKDAKKVEDKKTGKGAKRYVVLAVGAVLAVAAAYIYKKGGKEDLLAFIRDALLSLQSLRDYGAVGYVAFILAFLAQLTICLPGTMVVDVALGNIYGAVLGTTASVIAKTLSALLSLFIGRSFGKALGLEFPEALQKRMGAVQKRPLQALFLARLAPISTGVKNYALALLPAEDVPLLPYTMAVLAANLLVTTGVCILGAGADNLVDALDQVMSK